MKRHGNQRVEAREEAALRELAEVRSGLLQELRVLQRSPDYHRGPPVHLYCKRDRNQMLISPLEAHAIERAFRTDRRLARELPAVLERLRAELSRLRDNDERQGFDCPLLDGTRCLVHEIAKPIGCLAWHARPRGIERDGFTFTRRGWKAFIARDKLNDRVYGPEWKARVIPLWLRRVFHLDTGNRHATQRHAGQGRAGQGRAGQSGGRARGGGEPARGGPRRDAGRRREDGQHGRKQRSRRGKARRSATS